MFDIIKCGLSDIMNKSSFIMRRSQTFLCLLLQLQRVWRSLLDLLTSLFILCRETQSDSLTPAVIHVRNFTVKFVARFRWFLSFVNESMSKTFWWKHDQLFLPSVMSSLHFFLWMNISLHFSPGLFTSSVCLLAWPTRVLVWLNHVLSSRVHSLRTVFMETNQILHFNFLGFVDE